jgi:hypothetical protein
MKVYWSLSRVPELANPTCRHALAGDPLVPDVSARRLGHRKLSRFPRSRGISATIRDIHRSRDDDRGVVRGDSPACGIHCSPDSHLKPIDRIFTRS